MSFVYAAPARMAPMRSVSKNQITGLRRGLARIGLITAVFITFMVLFVVHAASPFAALSKLSAGFLQNHAVTSRAVIARAAPIDLLNNPSLIEQAILETSAAVPVHAAPGDLNRLKLTACSWNCMTSRWVNDFIASQSGDDQIAPRSPARRPTMIFGAAAIGLLAGLAFAFGERTRSERLQTIDEVAQLAPVPVFGTLPTHLKRNLETGVFMGRKQDALTEAMRSVRDNVYQAQVSGECCVVLITSASGGDGKSEIALNLARSLADDGKKAILVDADLRRGPAEKSYGATISAGAQTAIAIMAPDIAASTGLTDWVTTSRIPPFETYPNQAFYVLPSGPIPSNPAELMNRPRFIVAFETLRQEFDYVIIDSPALPAVADGLRLARRADIILSVVRPGHTLKDDFLTHGDMLARLGRPRGLVLNDIVAKANAAAPISVKTEMPSFALNEALESAI